MNQWVPSPNISPDTSHDAWTELEAFTFSEIEASTPLDSMPFSSTETLDMLPPRILASHQHLNHPSALTLRYDGRPRHQRQKHPPNAERQPPTSPLTQRRRCITCSFGFFHSRTPDVLFARGGLAIPSTTLVPGTSPSHEPFESCTSGLEGNRKYGVRS